MSSLPSAVPPDPGENSQLFPLPGKLFFMNHMAFVLAGSAIHRTTFGEFPCKPGQLYLIPPGVWHAYAGCQNLELYNCLLSPPLLDGPLSWAAEDPSLGPLLKQDPWQGSSQVSTWELPKTSLPEVRALLADLLHTHQQSGEARRGELVARLLLLLDFVAHRGRPTHAPNTSVIHSAARRAAHELHCDPARAWTLPQLASELRINPSYLVRIFRQATGCAPMKFLARERAHKAAQLLLTSELSVSEIGVRVGWEEPKQFARSFHQHFGESATAFRRRLRGGS